MVTTMSHPVLFVVFEGKSLSVFCSSTTRGIYLSFTHTLYHMSWWCKD